MSLVLESRDIAAQKRKNKISTLLIMGCFALSFTLLGYGFDYMMSSFNNYQLITVPVALVIAGSLAFNFMSGLNERFFGGQDPDGDRSIEYYSNKLSIWIFSTSFVLIVWMVCTEISYIDPHGLGKWKNLVVLGETSPYGVIISSLLGAGAAFSALQWGAYSILRFAAVARADRSFEYDRRALCAVEEISTIAAIKTPAVFVLQDDALNSFSVGRSPKRASIVLTQGLLENLDPEELKSVIAHEVSHIRTYDIRLRTVTTALFGSVLLLSHWTKLTATKGAAAGLALPTVGTLKKVFLFVFWVLSLAVVPVVAYIMVVLTARHREYLADASAAELTKNPEALIQALEKIEGTAGTSSVLKGNIAHLCIIDPLNRPFNSREGWFADILATHPPTARRIFCLRSLVPRYSPQ